MLYWMDFRVQVYIFRFFYSFDLLNTIWLEEENTYPFLITQWFLI